MKNENELRCPECGFTIYTESRERNCARCKEIMIYIGKRQEEKNKKRNRF